MSIEWNDTPQFQLMDSIWFGYYKAKDFISSKCHKGDEGYLDC
jgi:hypothetical protein